MSVETTYRINREDAIRKLENEGISVFHNDCNERLETELYNLQTEFEPRKNYDVVDFTEETEPENDKWPFWEY